MPDRSNFRVADHPGVGPSMTTSAFLGTYLVRLPTGGLLARVVGESVSIQDFRFCRHPPAIGQQAVHLGRCGNCELLNCNIH